MHVLTGGCHCGNIRAELQLPRESPAYAPRACDCEFCRKHAAAYVSDPQGALSLRILDERIAGTYRQGSGQAEMLFCKQCGVLVGALHRADGLLYGVVNAKVFDGGARFGAEQPVSPQALSADQKARRWQEIWCSDVTIISGKAAAAGGASGSQHE